MLPHLVSRVARVPISGVANTANDRSASHEFAGMAVVASGVPAAVVCMLEIDPAVVFPSSWERV